METLPLATQNVVHAPAVTWDLVRNAVSQVPPGTHCTEVCISTRSPSDWCDYSSLRVHSWRVGFCFCLGMAFSQGWWCSQVPSLAAPTRWQVPHLARSHELRERMNGWDGWEACVLCLDPSHLESIPPKAPELKLCKSDSRKHSSNTRRNQLIHEKVVIK